MTTATRYTLYQIPGIVVCALFLAIVWKTTQWPVSWAWMLLALWVVKDVAIYPLVRDAYEQNETDHGLELLGLSARVVEPLTPDGRVRVRGELWRARVQTDGAEPVEIPVGSDVRVEKLEGLRLLVSARPPAKP